MHLIEFLNNTNVLFLCQTIPWCPASTLLPIKTMFMYFLQMLWQPYGNGNVQVTFEKSLSVCVSVTAPPNASHLLPACGMWPVTPMRKTSVTWQNQNTQKLTSAFSPPPPLGIMQIGLFLGDTVAILKSLPGHNLSKYPNSHSLDGIV